MHLFVNPTIPVMLQVSLYPLPAAKRRFGNEQHVDILSCGVSRLRPEVSGRRWNCAILSTWACSLPLYVPQDTRQTHLALLLSDVPAVVVNNAPYPASERASGDCEIHLERRFSTAFFSAGYHSLVERLKNFARRERVRRYLHVSFRIPTDGCNPGDRARSYDERLSPGNRRELQDSLRKVKKGEVTFWTLRARGFVRFFIVTLHQRIFPSQYFSPTFDLNFLTSVYYKRSVYA